MPEAGEKTQSIYHTIKLHPYGPDAEKIREKKEPVVSQAYDEVIFNEPVEPFYDILTSGAVPQPTRGKGATKGSKQAALRKGGERTAEIPFSESPVNPFSQKTEAKELDRLNEAVKNVELLLKSEKTKLAAREKELEELRKSEGAVVKGK